MTAPLRCRGLSRWYGEVQGLSGLTADIGPGVVGLVGPNGSGKTTLMRLLTGQICPSRGSVEIFSQPMKPGDHFPFDRLGHVPGEDVHLEDERGIEFLVLMARCSGKSQGDAEQCADKALQKVDMVGFAHKRIREMSKGMRQRIKVAQALLLDPEVLLLDEPLNGLDPVSRRAILDLVRDLGKQGKTVLLASHVLHEVEAVTDRVLLLHHGRLLAEGRASEIRSLMEAHPRKVLLESPDPATLASKFLAAGLVSGIRLEENRLELETANLAPLLNEVRKLGEDGSIHTVTVEDESLESLFDLLLGESW